MSSKRFWEEPVDDETPGDDATDTPAAPSTFGKHSPVKPGGESALDPETGEWKPKHLLEEYEIGGHQFRMMEGPIASAEIKDADGNLLGTVQVPFDPADGEPSEAMLEDAMRVFHSLEYIRGLVNRDAVDSMVADLFNQKADGARPVTEIMVSTVADAIAEGAHIEFTDDGGDLTPEQVEALQVEVNRVFAEKMPIIVEEMAKTADPETGLNFWQQMAQDIIAHALMYARDDAIEEYGGPEAVEALDDEAAAKWEARVDDLYKTGPYLAGAYMQGWQGWLPVLGEITRAGIEYASEKPADDPDSMAARILKLARKNLGLPPIDIGGGGGKPPAIFQASLFGDDGYGKGNNSPLMMGVRHAFTAPKTDWGIDTDQWPIYTWGNSGGRAAYTPSRGDLETVAAAFEMVKRYGMKHQMLFHYVTLKHLAIAADGGPRAYGMFEFSVDEYLEARGTKKHPSGGYGTDDRREIVELLYDLAKTEVKGVAYARKGRKKEPQPVDVYSKLILISSRIEGDDYRFAIRGGDFMYQIEQAGKQYALTTRALLQLSQNHDANAIALGFFIQEQLRIRAKSDDLTRPFRMADLLAGAEILVDKKNPGRFQERIEKALDTLADPEKMRGAPILKSWKYKRKVNTYGRGWIDGWLDAGLILTPVQAYQNQQSKIRALGPRSKHQKPSA